MPPGPLRWPCRAQSCCSSALIIGIVHRMNHNPSHTELLHRTTIALTQLQRLLQQATDILSNLHTLYLLHTEQVDAHFQRSFPPLPPPPSCAVPIPSPTSSCDSAPTEPIKRAPQAPAASPDSLLHAPSQFTHRSTTSNHSSTATFSARLFIHSIYTSSRTISSGSLRSGHAAGYQ